ncbi:glycine zipper domain-containing protein [Phenylobacterium sp.]|uniref:glycine zipper domain-containing protein n=1 Tax=Phenylobacterium sp. TaxID=1871053 RepID=UPI003BA96345
MADPMTSSLANGTANGATANIADETAALDPMASGAKASLGEAAGAGRAATSALNDAAHSLLDAAKTLLEGKTEIVVAKGQKVYGKVKEQAVERFGDTDVLVREKPYLALGIAAAAGFLLGHLISSGRSQVVYLRDAR